MFVHVPDLDALNATEIRELYKHEIGGRFASSRSISSLRDALHRHYDRQVAQQYEKLSDHPQSPTKKRVTRSDAEVELIPRAVQPQFHLRGTYRPRTDLEEDHIGDDDTW